MSGSPMSPFFYKAEAGAKGLLPLPLTPNPRRTSSAPLRFGPSCLTIPNTCSQSPCQRSFAPTAGHLRSGMPFGFPTELAFTFTGIPTATDRHFSRTAPRILPGKRGRQSTLGFARYDRNVQTRSLCLAG
jgi:hypothetical protein